jgi:hypothetical protein
MTIFGKTPRVSQDYTVTAENFGRGMNMPFVTSNLMVSRNLVDWICEHYGVLFDEDFQESFEDYQAAWLIVKHARKSIRMLSHISNLHYHRLGFIKLRKEYYESGQGCQRFIDWAPESPLSKVRIQQFILMMAAWTFIGSALVCSLVSFALFLLQMQSTLVLGGMALFPALCLLVIAFLLMLGIVNVVKTGYPLALFFPTISVYFAVYYALGMIVQKRTLLVNGIGRERREMIHWRKQRRRKQGR